MVVLMDFPNGRVRSVFDGAEELPPPKLGAFVGVAFFPALALPAFGVDFVDAVVLRAGLSRCFDGAVSFFGDDAGGADTVGLMALCTAAGPVLSRAGGAAFGDCAGAGGAVSSDCAGADSAGDWWLA